jgi:type IV pilus assembly protein PilN
MARINLLPWREELRRERRQHYFIATGVAAGITLGALFLIHGLFERMIANQDQRNHFVEEKIAMLESQIKDIDDLEKEKRRLIDRMRAIESLQGTRPAIVHLFDEIVNTLPEGVFITELIQKGLDLTIKGVAQSNARVSSFMRNIESSPWLKSPQLNVVETVTQEGQKLNNFTLNVQHFIETAQHEKQGSAK